MSSPVLFRRPVRGRPALGFQLEVPSEVDLRDGAALECREVRQDGRIVGELEANVFAGALIIDRDGILAEQAEQAIANEPGGRGRATAVAVQLPGASGFRADAVHGGRLPYVCAFAIAPRDHGVDGGVLIVVRSARPDWPAAEHMLQSLRIVTRRGVITESDVDDGEPALPVVAPLRG